MKLPGKMQLPREIEFETLPPMTWDWYSLKRHKWQQIVHFPLFWATESFLKQIERLPWWYVVVYDDIETMRFRVALTPLAPFVWLARKWTREWRWILAGRSR